MAAVSVLCAFCDQFTTFLCKQPHTSRGPLPCCKKCALPAGLDDDAASRYEDEGLISDRLEDSENEGVCPLCRYDISPIRNHESGKRTRRVSSRLADLGETPPRGPHPVQTATSATTAGLGQAKLSDGSDVEDGVFSVSESDSDGIETPRSRKRQRKLKAQLISAADFLYFPPEHPFLLQIHARHRTMVPDDPKKADGAGGGGGGSSLRTSSVGAPAKSQSRDVAQPTSPVWNYVDRKNGQCVLKAANGAARCQWKLVGTRTAARVWEHLKNAKGKHSVSHGMTKEAIEAGEGIEAKVVVPVSVAEMLLLQSGGKSASVKKYDGNDGKQMRFNKLLEHLVLHNNIPLDFVERPEFHELIQFLDPKLSIVSRRTLTRSWIPERCGQMYAIIADILVNSAGIHLSVDGWSSKMAVSFLGVVAHCIRGGAPVSVLLHMMEVNAASKDAGVLQQIFYKVIDDWKLMPRVTGMSGDGAGMFP